MSIGFAFMIESRVRSVLDRLGFVIPPLLYVVGLESLLISLLGRNSLYFLGIYGELVLFRYVDWKNPSVVILCI